MEAVGELIVVGAGLTGQKIGDSVVYAGDSIGSYAEEQILPADEVVPVPPPVLPIIALVELDLYYGNGQVHLAVLLLELFQSKRRLLEDDGCHHVII
ncbi:hypothetical protein SLEP1_g28035 [Rubroshorea leprosula]|uniref:Quinone oxidoreductase n=1 Tax=Rubroshorea leprosula TaxID=152421 RepID=A0AAV5JSA7_9ROSI|nr:hypothetical protein SLEP1_g28035 [Rubroshorea leprosula]